MKIAEITSTFPPYRGGIGNVALHNALELERRGHDITVFTPRYKSLWDKTPQKFSDPENIKIKRMIPIFKYGNAAIIPQLFFKLKKFEVIHLHYPFFGGAEIIFLWKLFNKFFRKKTAFKYRLVVTYHMDVVGRGFLGWYFRFYNKFITPHILRLADKITVSSKDYIKNSKISNFFESYPDKFVEVPNGVDIENFKPREKSGRLLAKHALLPSDKIILFVGGLDRAHYFKGVEYLIRAMKLLRDPKIKLLIVGEGDLKEHYINLSKSLDLSARIIFTGFAEDEVLPDYYNLCDLLVLPSIDRSEAFGVVLIEAMASGKPVIASNLPGVRGVIDNGKTGFLVNLKNEGDLASKIKNILQNNELRNKMGDAGRIRAEELYSWKKIGQKLDEIIIES